MDPDKVKLAWLELTAYWSSSEYQLYQTNLITVTVMKDPDLGNIPHSDHETKNLAHFIGAYTEVTKDILADKIYTDDFIYHLGLFSTNLQMIHGLDDRIDAHYARTDEKKD